jgi:hypothetical protein
MKERRSGDDGRRFALSTKLDAKLIPTGRPLTNL